MNLFLPSPRCCRWRIWRLGQGRGRCQVRLHDWAPWHWKLRVPAARKPDHPLGWGDLPGLPGRGQLHQGHVQLRWTKNERDGEENMKGQKRRKVEHTRKQQQRWRKKERNIKTKTPQLTPWGTLKSLTFTSWQDSISSTAESTSSSSVHLKRASKHNKDLSWSWKDSNILRCKTPTALRVIITSLTTLAAPQDIDDHYHHRRATPLPPNLC